MVDGPNGQSSNGRNGYAKLLIFGSIGGSLGTIAFIINLFVGPVREIANRLDLQLNAPVVGIVALAAQRGIEIPRLREDILRLENEIVRLRAQIDRIEQAQRSQARPQ